MSANPAAASADITEIDRAARAAELAVLGWPYHKIAAELGYAGESGARMAVKRHFQRRATTAYEEMRPVLHERCEELWRKAYRRINLAEQTNNFEQWSKAMDQAFRAIAQSARVNRLDTSGTQVNINVGQGPRDVEALKAEFLAMRAAVKHVDSERVIDGENMGLPAQTTG